ncbi:hypothetical protein WGW31_08840, partial [Campylobacter jejuni]
IIKLNLIRIALVFCDVTKHCYFNFIFQGHLCQLLSFLTSRGGGIEKFCFRLSIVTFLSINAFAATQAN